MIDDDASSFQSIKKLNREIDGHLKQPDDNKFTTLKVTLFFRFHKDHFL